MASLERLTKTVDSLQLMRSIQRGDTGTFLPAHQFPISTRR
jgi:hypothetical protein